MTSALIISERAMRRIPDEFDPGPTGDLVPWYLHPNPTQLIGTGYLCSRCGRPFTDMTPIQVWERPETGETLSFRHKGCQPWNIVILYMALIKLNRRLDGARWYHAFRMKQFTAWIRNDRIAEPTFLQEFEVRYHKSAIRGGILPNDYTVPKVMYERTPDNRGMVETEDYGKEKKIYPVSGKTPS